MYYTSPTVNLYEIYSTPIHYTQGSDTKNLRCKSHSIKKEGSTSINLTETDTTYFVEASIPGFEKKDISINYDAHKNILTLSGKNPEEDKHEDETQDKEKPIISSKDEKLKVLFNEFTIPSSFKKEIKLHFPISIEGIEANLNNGILKLTIPKNIREYIHNIDII